MSEITILYVSTTNKKPPEAPSGGLMREELLLISSGCTPGDFDIIWRAQNQNVFYHIKIFCGKKAPNNIYRGEKIDDTYCENSPYIFLETLHFFRNLTFFSIKNSNSAQKSINYAEQE